MLVKVCGMREQRNADEVAALGIEMMGFIFYPPSPRYVGDSTPSTPSGVERVGVFVNAEREEILKCVDSHCLDIVQLHGAESSEFCSRLRAEGIKVIKAISVAEAQDLDIARLYDRSVDYLLFDTKCVGYGGSGEQFDWSLLDNYSLSTPFLLSGGIDEDAACSIAQISHKSFVGVDLNSRFECAPAFKEPKKIEKFINKIR